MNNCLVLIRNKKLNADYVHFGDFMRVFSEACYYFDKTAVVGFDSSKGIAEQLKECKTSFDNAIVLCYGEQRDMIADFLAKIYGEQFEGNFLTCVF